MAGNPKAHAGKIYDLVGSRAITAANIAQHAGLPYQPESLEVRRATLNCSGLLPFQPGMLLSLYSAAAHGFLASTSNSLAELLGHPLTDPVPVAAAMVQQP
ncbi:hypothetical protein [Corynebacterium sp. A21]|uniref:hypothetical protein n=1 Tax=Corynebacterium sp. A21 TaxID=3457318 RepID=UPI003FD4848A